MKRLLTMGVAGVCILTGTGAGACASAPAPNDKLASAEAALRASHQLGAQNVPQAQLLAQLAEEQIARARKLMEDDDNERAAFVLERAQADADLSVALARQDMAREQLDSLGNDNPNPQSGQ